MLAVALALASSVAWGISDFIGGLKSRRLAVPAVLLVSQATGLALVATIVLARSTPAPGAEFAVYAALSALAGIGGLAALYRGLAVGAMSVVAPISATAVIVPVAVGTATGDRLSAAQIAGIAVAVGGVMLAAREPAHGREPGDRIAAGTGLALLAALGFGCFFVAMDAASDGDVFWAILVNRITGVALLALTVLALRPSLAVGGADLAALVAIGVFDISANTLFAIASTKGLVSLVSVVSALYPVVAVILARVILKERIARPQQAGVAIALAGVVLITVG